MELKPCPFCGKAPYFIKDNSYGECMIGCNCRAEPCVSEPKSEIETAIKAWNTRIIEDKDNE